MCVCVYVEKGPSDMYVRVYVFYIYNKHIGVFFFFVMLSRSETFEQLEVPLDVFGKAGAYLKG